MLPVHQVWPKPSYKAQWKGEEDKTDRGRGGKTTSGNGQAWSLASPRGQSRGKWRKLVAKSSVVLQRPSRLRDWWWWWEQGILRMRVSAEEWWSLEGVYRWRSSERYYVPVKALKQNMEILHCIHALIGNQHSDWRMDWTWSFFVCFCLADKSGSCVLSFLQSVNEVLWTASECKTEEKHRRESEFLEQWVDGVASQFVCVKCMLICKRSVHAESCLSGSQVWRQFFSQKEQNALQNFQATAKKEGELVSKLIGVLSPVSHQGLYQGWRRKGKTNG